MNVEIMYLSVKNSEDKNILYLEFRYNETTIKRVQNKINKIITNDGFKNQFEDTNYYYNEEGDYIDCMVNGLSVPMYVFINNDMIPFDNGYILKINDDGTETYEKLTYRDFFKIETLKGLL